MNKTCKNVDESTLSKRGHAQKTIYSVIPFIKKILEKTKL
jgi:hypothetical protein